MSVDFRHIFPGEGMRTRKKNRQHVVQCSAPVIYNVPVVHLARDKARKAGRGGAKNPFEQMFCQRAGNADDAHAARAGSSGHCCDGVRPG